ncbi:MAG TPA: hypothetical protein VGP43_00950 [Chitinophagaceae bacterium]|nr:hypothetical protein [Chitinophagaceae bacterium]
MKKSLIPFIAVILWISACGPTIYKSAEFGDVTSRHKLVAILPADVFISLRPNATKKTSVEEMENNRQSTGYAIQDKMYSWFLNRSDKFKYTVKFQDVSKTNALLKDAGISYTALRDKSKESIAKLLGVDAVISNITRMDKPMSEGVAVAIGVILGSWGTTNNVTTTINIHEAQKGDLIWKYDYVAQGSFGSSPENLVNGLMRNASRKFPYNEKK